MKEKIDTGNLPQHIAVIMDGNGRWAKKQGAMRVFGHHHGVTSVRETVKACAELGIKYLTMYTFSTENWNRPRLEVDAIMQLLVKTISDEVADLHKNGVRLQMIGNVTALPKKAQKEMLAAIELTQANRGLTLILALSYSGKWEIVEACKQLAKQVEAGKISIEQITEDAFAKQLSVAPNVDLLIRTGGDHRISNYLLWQLAYAELCFLDEIFWPEFRQEHLFQAIIDYQQRERRFGKTSEQVSQDQI